MDTSRLAGLIDLLVRRVKFGISDVVHDRVVEEDGALWNNANLVAQARVVLLALLAGVTEQDVP